jgi:hypothetical protein
MLDRVAYREGRLQHVVQNPGVAEDETARDLQSEIRVLRVVHCSLQRAVGDVDKDSLPGHRERGLDKPF